MKTRLAVSAVVLLAIIYQLMVEIASGSESEGYRGRITRNGLKYASQLGVEMLMKFLPVAEIPDLYEQMGGMSVVLSNITITDFQRPELDLDLIPNTRKSFGGLKMVFRHLNPSIECHMKMTYEWGFLSSTRELFVTIATSNLSVTLEALIGIDSGGDGEPVGVLNCQIEGSVQMASKTEESSAFSGLFDFVASNFNERLKNMIFTQACQNITTLFNSSIKDQLSPANMSRIVLDEDLVLDLRFTQSPKVTDKYLEANHVGKLYLTNDSLPTQGRLKPRPSIPALPELSSRMMYAFITDRSVNSVWNASARSNKLRLPVNPNMPGLSKAFRGFLRISCTGVSQCIGKIYPQLRNLSRQKLVELELVAKPSQRQYFRFQDRIIHFHVPISSEFFLKTKKKSREILVSTSSVWSGSANVSFKENRVFFNFTKFSMAVSDSQTQHARLPASENNSRLKEFAKIINRRIIMPFLKEFGSEGYPLEIPMLPWFKIVHTEISQTRSQNLIVLGTDVQLNTESIPDLRQLL